MKTLFITVMRKLQEDLPELRYISEDWGQLDHYSDKPPVNWPCALISISSGQDTTQTKDNRKRATTLQVRIADTPSYSANAAAPSSQIDIALRILEITDRVGDVLHGLEVEGYKSDLAQINFTKVLREDGIREYAVYFRIEKSK